MRTLLLMRGAPGAGKTTWIEKHHLKNYTLSPDDIRILCSSVDLNAFGEFSISQERDNENEVWSVLFKILEHRMQRGEFTVIDATCSKTKDMQQYKDLASKYRYRMFCVDFTGVPLETCLKQNRMRPQEKIVPDKAILNIYARYATQKVPAGIKVIQPDEFESILDEPFDVSEYEKLVFVGDIHGCFDTLMQYPDFKNGLNPKYEYIFLGDYIDRGNQNCEVLKWLDSIKDLPNVCLLEGNHERWIRDYGEGVPARSREFEYKTKPALIEGGFDEKMARMFYRKCRQFSHITYNGLEILACHGGIPNLNTNPLFLPTDKFIHGAGTYSDYITVSESWMAQTKENQFLVHGHRNTEGSEIDICDRVFNLEGRVEFGGQLRIVELDRNLKWTPVYLDDCQPVNENLNTEERPVETVKDAVDYLRNNRFVNEKDQGRNISSFNFSREAFEKGNWNRQTILARGLFIDTAKYEVAARSYEKFFRVGEVAATEPASLKSNLVFPVSAYLKENGFLAIVSYDEEKDDLLIASKSSLGGDFAKYIHTALHQDDDKLWNSLLNWFREKQKTLQNPDEKVSFVFECIDVKNDPHIIKYDKSKLVLLDIIKNKLTFEKLGYNEMSAIADELGFEHKKLVYEFKDWDSLYEFYKSLDDVEYQLNGEYVEGFVFEDSAGFMFKAKTGYYDLWKKLRGVATTTLRCGYITKTGMLTSYLENLFYAFCRDAYENDAVKTKGEAPTYPYPTDIISLREKFMEKCFDSLSKFRL